MVMQLDRYSPRRNKEFYTALWRDDLLTQAQRHYGTLDPTTNVRPIVDREMTLDAFLPGLESGADVKLAVIDDLITYRAHVTISMVRKIAVLRCPATPWNLERIATHYETAFQQPCPPLDGTAQQERDVPGTASRRVHYPRLYVKAGGKTR